MVMASLISLVGVAVLFIAGFGGFRYPLMTVAALILAMTWSFAYITLAVGHLNILSVSFGAIVIGLGIDFGIHYVARYMQLRESSAESEAALIETASTVGPGIVTGGVTTSLAFFTAALTEFTGISELGVVAGGGIALCILSALIVLPSMIILADRKRESRVAPNTLPLAELCAPAMKTPLRTLLIGGVATAALVTAASGLRYDHNLLNLQPVRLESVKWERLLLARTDRSVWFALSIAADPQQLLERKAAFESLPTVERTEEIVSLLPTADPDRTDAIARIHNRLGRLPQQAPVVPAAGSLPERTNAAVSSLQRMLPMNAMTKPALDSLLQLQRHLQATAPNDAAERLFDHQQHAAAELLDRFQHLARVSRPEPPSAADVDPALAERFVGRRQQHLLKVFARGDVWDMHALERFVSDLESIDPGVTGHPVQTYYASRHMQQSYIHAALYAFLAISIVLMLDFRSIRHSLLAMTPMALGLAQMAGLLALLDIPLNAANMIVLPLILGIGIDDGVHVVHDYRRRRGVYQISGSTAAAIVVTSATTMLGFGSMMFAKHQGLRSLGQVLTLGVFCCLVSSLFLLPALLSKLGPGSDSAESER